MQHSGIYLSRSQFWGMFVVTPLLTLAAMLAMVTFLRPGPSVLQVAYAGGADDDQQILREGKLLAEVREVIRTRYVDAPEPDQVLFGACRGMVTALDDHSDFMPPAVYDEERIDTLGHFGGLGIVVELVDGWLTVVTPIEDTPAERAGVRAGDRIVAIEGVSTEGWRVVDAADKLRGEPGTSVTLTVVHAGERRPTTIAITRAEIHVSTVKGARMVAPGVGYVRLTSFVESTAEKLDAAVAELKAQSMRALVLDLRHNPGGLLRQGVAVADRWLAAGQRVVEVRGRGADREVHEATADASLAGVPTAVLVNGRSASASEIVAAALQDHGVARLFGERTYGKGTVQTIVEVDEGRSAVRLTTARYYSPKGRTIQPATGERGLAPDEPVEMSDAEFRELREWWRATDIRRPDGSQPPPVPDSQLDAAVRWLAGQIGK